MHNDNTRYKQAKKITAIGAAINAALGVIKILGGIFFKSHGLIADGVHSFSDLLTDSMVLIASKYGSQEADTTHPYGHQRIETAATMLLSILLILAGLGIAWDSISLILNKSPQKPELFAIPIAIISIILNEILYHATLKVGKSINSRLLVANAWHHRSDAASSAIVLTGIIGAMFGLPFLDPLAAVIIGFMVIKMGITYAINSIKELVDTGVTQEKILEIETTINSIDGVKKTHQLRNRMMGKDMFIDVHILVEPFISVSEGHHIAQRVHRKLLDDFVEVSDVTIHVDPEDDEVSSPSFELPSRKELESSLLNNWLKNFPQIEKCSIHYSNGKIVIDVNINKDLKNTDLLVDLIKNDISNIKNICIINLLINHEKIVN